MNFTTELSTFLTSAPDAMNPVANVTSHDQSDSSTTTLPRPHVWATAVCLSTTIFLALNFNLVTLAAILKYFRRFTVSCYFVVNLLVADVLFDTVMLVIMIIRWTTGVAHTRAVCLSYMSCSLCTCTTVQLSLLLTLSENFITIEFPFRYRDILSRRHAVYSIAATWLYSVTVMCILANTPLFNSWSAGRECRLVNIYNIAFRTYVIAQVTLVTVVLLVVYLRVLVVAVHHYKRMVRHGHAAHVTHEEMARIRDTCTSIQRKGGLVTCFLVCWLPACLVQACHMFLTPQGLLIAMDYADLCLLLNTGANPVICAWRNRQFRLAIAAMFRRDRASGSRVCHPMVLFA